MLSVFENKVYSKLFSAQVIALLGTGLLTVALGLLAFNLAGDEAGIVLGITMTIKMVAYVFLSPIMAALLVNVEKKTVLISADVLRAVVALALPFVTEAWQIYILIFLLQSASATFTPTFQAVIPTVIPDEREYTKALSLSRLAYDLESLLSPMIAASLLTVISFHNLFIGTVLGFLLSAILVFSAKFPTSYSPTKTKFINRLTSGAKEFWSNKELLGLMGLNLVSATSTAMIIVNTVVLVQGVLGKTQTDVALILGAYGLGSLLVALTIPRLLEAVSDHKVMGAGALVLAVLLLSTAATISWSQGELQWITLFVLWFLFGSATAAVLTPSARLLRRNSNDQNRSAVFVAQFSLSHACYLITYPLAGILGAKIGLAEVSVILAGIALVGLTITFQSWRSKAAINTR